MLKFKRFQILIKMKIKQVIDSYNITLQNKLTKYKLKKLDECYQKKITNKKSK